MYIIVHPLDCERLIAHKSARCHRHIASATKHIYYIQSPLNNMKSSKNTCGVKSQLEISALEQNNGRVAEDAIHSASTMHKL